LPDDFQKLVGCPYLDAFAHAIKEEYFKHRLAFARVSIAVDKIRVRVSSTVTNQKPFSQLDEAVVLAFSSGL
jgi:hypothetical protein